MKSGSAPAPFKQSKLRLLIAILMGAAIGYALGRWHGSMLADNAAQRVVAVAWGDGKYGKAFYGGEVYTVLVPSGHSVRARVWIGNGSGMEQDVGEIDVVATHEQAVERWGRLNWQDDGLHIGPNGGKDFVVPRSQIESHR